MIVHYKRNKHTACFYSDNTVERVKAAQIEKIRGPFESCGDCPYVSQGFICFGKEGDCLKTDMAKINRRKKQCTQ